MIKITVGDLYYAFATVDENTGEITGYKTTIASSVVKNISTTENADTTTVRASGQDFTTIRNVENIELAVETIAFPREDLAMMRSEEVTSSGLVFSGRGSERPYFAFGMVVKKSGDEERWVWFPRCQLIENTDDIATSEDSFSEQNDTLTIRVFAFNEHGDNKVYVDSEFSSFPAGLAEETFFTKPILTDADITAAVSAKVPLKATAAKGE